MTGPGAEVGARGRIGSLWRAHRARWTLPVVIIVVIALVAVIDRLGSHRISEVDEQSTSNLVAVSGGSAKVEIDEPWAGFNPNTPAGAASSSPMLLSSVLPSAYTLNPKLVPQVNSSLLVSVEATSTSPLTIQYVINPRAEWSDGVPVTADDFIYAWQSQRGDGVDIDGHPDQVASTLGYRDVQSVTGSDGGKTVTVKFSTPFTDWRILFDNMVPAHIARKVGWNSGFATFDQAIEVSAGPYVLRSVSGSGTALLVRNPHWWGTPATLRQVTVSTASNQQAWTSVLGTDNQAVIEATSFSLRTLNAVSSLPNTQSQVSSSLDFLSLEFNVLSPVTDQVPVREAVARIVDRAALIAKTVGTIEPSIKPSQDHLATANQSTYSPSSAAAAYSVPNVAMADSLLRSAGYHKSAAGTYVDAGGSPLTLRMAVESDEPWIAEVGSLLAGQLRQAGIIVTIVPVDGTTGLITANTQDAYDIALVDRTSSPYQTVTEGWYSFGLGPTGSPATQNWSNFDDPAVDQYFAQAAQDLNPVTGGTVYAQIDDQLWDQMVALPLFQLPSLLANGVQIDNVLANPSTDGTLWNLPQWATLRPGPSHAASAS